MAQPPMRFELACGLKFDFVRHGLAYGENYHNQCYAKHQASCALCLQIPFRAIKHLKYNVTLRCGLKCTSLQRADYNMHRSQCSKCKPIIFSRLQTNLQYVSALCCGKKIFNNDHDQFLARFTTKRNQDEILRCAVIDHYSVKENILEIGFNNTTFFPTTHLAMPPSQACSMASLGCGYLRIRIDAIHTNCYNTEPTHTIWFEPVKKTKTYSVGPILENVWIAFRHNITYDLQTTRNIIRGNIFTTLVPSSISCLIGEYDIFDSYETLCVITCCFLALWEQNLEKLQKCNVPIFYQFVLQNTSFMILLQSDGNLSLVFTKFLQDANVFYNSRLHTI